MTEKIKRALKEWAEKVLKNEAQWDYDAVHQTIQKLYELSVCQKVLMEDTSPATDLWKRQQAELSSVLEALTGTSSETKVEKEEELEVPPMMETIKNMVTEMPEPENYERLFEVVKEPPVFVPKTSRDSEFSREKTPIPNRSGRAKKFERSFCKINFN